MEKHFAKPQKQAEARAPGIPVSTMQAGSSLGKELPSQTLREDLLNWSPDVITGLQEFQAVPYEEDYDPAPCLSSAGLVPVSCNRLSAPSAMFTPTAAKLCPEETQDHGLYTV